MLMARRKRTPEDALASAMALIAEHYDVACVVVPDRTKCGKPYTRWIPVGNPTAAEALLEAGVKRGMTATEAEEEVE
jgi:hypothetical protein